MPDELKIILLIIVAAAGLIWIEIDRRRNG
jgi:hypothetical protein